MDRRDFLKSSTGAAALAVSAAVAAAPASADRAAATTAGEGLGVATPAIVTDVRQLTLAMDWPDSGRGPSDSARRLARQIALLSGGKLEIAVTAKASGGFSALMSGEADLWHGPASAFIAQHRAFAYFAGLPGDAGLGRHDTAAWLTVGGGQLLWDDLAAGSGFKPLLAGSNGQRGALWSSRPIATLSDLEGMRVHAEGLTQDVARALGADPVTIPAGEVARRLAGAEIGAVQGGGALWASATGIAESARNCMACGLQRHGGLSALAVARGVWDGLTASEQAIVTAAAAEAFQASVAEARAHDAMMRRVLAEQHGTVFAPLPAEIREAVSRVTDAVVAHVAGGDAEARRINASYMAFKDLVRSRPRPGRAEA